MSIPREAEIREALANNPDLTDRQIARLLDIRLWSKVRRVRELLAAEAAATPVVEVLPAPRLPQIAAHPTVICGNCGREGTPADADPTRCKACHAGGAAARAAWPTPPPAHLMPSSPWR